MSEYHKFLRKNASDLLYIEFLDFIKHTFSISPLKIKNKELTLKESINPFLIPKDEHKGNEGYKLDLLCSSNLSLISFLFLI